MLRIVALAPACLRISSCLVGVDLLGAAVGGIAAFGYLGDFGDFRRGGFTLGLGRDLTTLFRVERGLGGVVFLFLVALAVQLDHLALALDVDPVAGQLRGE